MLLKSEYSIRRGLWIVISRHAAAVELALEALDPAAARGVEHIHSHTSYSTNVVCRRENLPQCCLYVLACTRGARRQTGRSPAITRESPEPVLAERSSNTGWGKSRDTLRTSTPESPPTPACGVHQVQASAALQSCSAGSHCSGFLQTVRWH